MWEFIRIYKITKIHKVIIFNFGIELKKQIRVKETVCRISVYSFIKRISKYFTITEKVVIEKIENG